IHYPPNAGDGNHDGKKLAQHGKDVSAALHKAMPDFHVEVRCIAVNGDQIQLQTHSAGTPPGGAPFKYDAMSQVRVNHGQVARIYGFISDPSDTKTIDRLHELLKAGGLK